MVSFGFASQKNACCLAKGFEGQNGAKRTRFGSRLAVTQMDFLAPFVIRPFW